MVEQSHAILIVDDDLFNLDILARLLKKRGYQTMLATGGEEAWELLEADPERFSLVLLDRMMPGMDGIEVLKKMKDHNDLMHVPVIMQTAASAPKEIAEGISHGVYYYLTKPFTREVLFAIVNTALKDFFSLLAMRENLKKNTLSLQNLDQASFSFSTLEEGINIANLLAHVSSQPITTGIGLKELITNAIEHGNLGISYKEKGDLLEEDRLMDEIERRLALPENRDKKAVLSMERSLEDEEELASIKFTIEDMGDGFP